MYDLLLLCVLGWWPIDNNGGWYGGGCGCNDGGGSQQTKYCTIQVNILVDFPCDRSK